MEINSLPKLNLKTTLKAQEKSINKWKEIAGLCLFFLTILILGLYVYTYVSYEDAEVFVNTHLDRQFFFMLAVGFFAQMIDGALGMGYGVISTTMLLSGGLNPAVISGSI